MGAQKKKKDFKMKMMQTISIIARYLVSSSKALQINNFMKIKKKEKIISQYLLFVFFSLKKINI